MSDVTLQAFLDELEKIAAWGKNIGKSWGMSSTKGGWATHFRSAGMQTPPETNKAMPALKGIKTWQTKTPVAPAPPRYGEVNNQASLRRNLSNVTLPKNVE